MLSFMKNGLPDSQKYVTLGQKHYWKVKEDMHEENGIFFPGTNDHPKRNENRNAETIASQSFRYPKNKSKSKTKSLLAKHDK